VTQPGVWSSKKLGYEFSNPDLLNRALTHKSKSALNNERLEYLGDAVLDLVIANALYASEPDVDEGGLSRLRSRLVRHATLADIADELGVGERLLLGSGELRSGGHQRRSLMADALEALYGAVFIDGGYDAAQSVILSPFAERIANLPDAESLKDPKTKLQEALQSRGLVLPDYKVVDESGPPHDRHFIVRCNVVMLSIDVSGEGASRRSAEQMAAREALRILIEEHDDAS